MQDLARLVLECLAMNTATRSVAGHSLRLAVGVRYWASRPMAERGMRTFPVTIEPAPGAPRGARTVTVDGLSYEAANDLVNAFNNEASSWSGRVWS